MLKNRFRALALAVVLCVGLTAAPASAQRGRKTFAAVTVTTTATQILAASTVLRSAVIVNNGSVTVYLGKDNTVTTSNGIPLVAGQSLSDKDSLDAWYGITASGSANVRVLETK